MSDATNSTLRNRKRRRFIVLSSMLLAMTALIVAATAVAFGDRRTDTSTGPATFPPESAKLEKLREIAKAAASETDGEVSQARVFYSTHAVAVSAAFDEGVLGNELVYVVAMQGKFSTAKIYRRPGREKLYARRPFTPSLTLIVDAQNDRVLAAGQGIARDLSILGRSITLEID